MLVPEKLATTLGLRSPAGANLGSRYATRSTIDPRRTWPGQLQPMFMRPFAIHEAIAWTCQWCNQPRSTQPGAPYTGALDPLRFSNSPTRSRLYLDQIVERPQTLIDALQSISASFGHAPMQMRAD